MKRLMITLAATTLFASATFAEEQAAVEEQAAAPAEVTEAAAPAEATEAAAPAEEATETAAVDDAQMYPHGQSKPYTKPNWGVENIIDQIGGDHSLGLKKPDNYGYN